MDGALKELAKLEKLTSKSSAGNKGKSPAINDSLDLLLQTLYGQKKRLEDGLATEEELQELAKTVETRKKEIDDRQKEVYNCLARYGKALDKRFTSTLPTYDPLFASKEAESALEHVIAMHFLRTGRFSTAETFIEEFGIHISPDLQAHFIDLHRILLALRNDDIGPALEWVMVNRDFLAERQSSLEFYLHRSEYIRLLLSEHADTQRAINYANKHLGAFWSTHTAELRRLMSCIMYLPLERLQKSPYADLASSAVHFELEPMFGTEFSAKLGMSKQAPLRVVADIGGGGALAKIEKGRKIMRERKSEWSQAGELPIEIPLPPENRYHSIFACPVSKDQSTEQNPPMMMTCGHVIAKDSLQKLSKANGPARSSPPPRSSTITNTLVAQTSFVSDVSRSSAISNPELASLTPDEIDFIDAVIKRASPSATTFLTVFKAYNDVLRERGLDPQNEVVYYSKLLKLGTLKGSNWGDKWRTVKSQNGYVAASAPVPTQAKANHVKQEASAPMSSAARLLMRLKHLQHGERDESPAKSFDDEADVTETDDVTETEGEFTETTNSLGLDIGTSYNVPPSPPHTKARSRPIPINRGISRESVVSESLPSLSTIPPSYKRSTHDIKPPQVKTRAVAAAPRAVDDVKRPLMSRARANTARAYTSPRSLEHKPPAPPAPVRVDPPAPRKSVINEEEAWEKIRMAEDEKEADKFREDRLVERCWEVWKQGYEWITTTSEQIAQARDTLILRLAIHRWRVRLAQCRDFEQQVQTLADQKLLKSALTTWKAKLKVKQQEKWRTDMRLKMKTVREKRESKLRKDAWAKWRQSYRSHLSGQHYSERLVMRAFGKWKEKLVAIDRLDAVADEFVAKREGRAIGRAWDMWRGAMELKNLEAVVSSRVSTRLAKEVLDGHRDRAILKNTISKWNAAQDRTKALERRADKHVARQDDVLVRAVMRVWRAHERGKLLVRVQNTRLLKQAWAIWKARIRQQSQLEEKALTFSMRSGSYLASSTMKLWRQRYANQQNAEAFAVQYHSAQLQFQTMLAWRLALRAKLKLVRQGRVAEKFFAVRRAWRLWVQRAEEQKREKKLKELEVRRTKKLFRSWLQQALRQRHHRLAEQELRDRITMRILKSSLSQWTNCVIALKLREIEVAQKNDKVLVLSAFNKWKGVCIRHVEELSLMESYQDVKREESMRRMFNKWLAAARTARNRRITLAQKEAEMKRYRLTAAWDKFRGRFRDEQLRPLERTFQLQNQNAIMFRAFVTWHSKTKSLPAVRFHAETTKARFWKVWRDAMPRALQAKEARDKDRQTVLSKAFSKWLQAHRTKIALRAVAYSCPPPCPLRLPPASYSPAPPFPHAPPPPRQKPTKRGKTRYEKTKEGFEARDIDVDFLQRERLDLFHYGALGRLMRIYAGLHEDREGVETLISGETLQMLQVLVEEFVRELARRAIVSREQEQDLKSLTKAWRLGEKQVVQSNVVHALEMMGMAYLDKRSQLTTILPRFDISVDDDDGEADAAPQATEPDYSTTDVQVPINDARHQMYAPFVRIPGIELPAPSTSAADREVREDLLSEEDVEDICAELDEEVALNRVDTQAAEECEQALLFQFGLGGKEATATTRQKAPPPPDADEMAEVHESGKKRKRRARDENAQDQQHKKAHVTGMYREPDGIRIKSAVFVDSDEDD
ncbi:hypothetical protein EWM64_g113 [Hericium alpestre]|uniref:GID complex catalytic subunit 2 n=1 Tax=Hericium alpestre TaxID=135208 RepID=A0A4Z0AC24_9AGAM|nr:hypothetical protein EWM64_g113 [Hericium alpestre]